MKARENAAAVDEAAAAAVPELVEAVVARGRSVVDGTGKPKRAGETALVGSDEINGLRALGYLIDPKAAEVPIQKGPSISASDGPSMVRLA